mmetsp:Transcript_26222/g.44597  ORF Transcript_26222/g.44597 Transcript_26222/m.44597 type:complete len:171 (+) Transcript_26222:42-554(+)
MHYPPEQEVFTVATHHSSHDKDVASSSSSSKFATVQNSSLCRSPSARWFVGALMVLLSLSLVQNVRKENLLSEVPDYPLTKKQPLHQHSVRFMPYPHKTLGSGTSLQCQWETRPIVSSNTSKESYLDLLNRMLILRVSASHLLSMTHCTYSHLKRQSNAYLLKHKIAISN